jgi:hypothetical protein
MDSHIQVRFLRLPSVLLLSILLSISSAQSIITSISTSSTTSQAFAIPTSVPTTPPPTNTDTSNDANNNENIQHAVFNYYFLIVAVVVILLCVGILYFRSRKKRKAALIRSHSQRALAQDVAGFRNRWGINRVGGIPYLPNNRGRSDPEEGLDERGEAPPPYVPGPKPPSIRMIDGVLPVGSVPSTQVSESARDEQALELQDIHRNVDNAPPSYDEQPSGMTADTSVSNSAPRSDEGGNGTTGGMAGIVEVTRPSTALIASERDGSTRRLSGNSGSLAGNGHLGL